MLHTGNQDATFAASLVIPYIAYPRFSVKNTIENQNGLDSKLSSYWSQVPGP